MTRVEHRSQRHTWQTPDVVLERVRRVGEIALDPATAPENPTGAKRYITPQDSPDGLAADWTAQAGGGLIFINPPYGRDLGRVWVPKIVEEAAKGARIISLVKASTDTQWFKKLVARAVLVCFWEGRLTFRGAPAPAPFPSCLVLHSPVNTIHDCWPPLKVPRDTDMARFGNAFGDAGHVWSPRPVLEGHR